MRVAVALFISAIFLVFYVQVLHPGEDVEPAPLDNLRIRVEKIQREREEKDRIFREAPTSPLVSKDQRNFKGLTYYPADLRYVFSGHLERNPKGRKEYVKLPTNRGNFRTYIKEGIFRFKLEGKEFALIVYRFLGRSNLFLPFRDKTNGQETYDKGRYVEVEIVSDDEIIVDFNKAYNPFCAYNPKYTCAYASEENTLDVAVPCGEKKFIASP